MRIIPVLDLTGGRAVHARSGNRSRYVPVRSTLAPEAEGDAVVLLRAYQDRLGLRECYVADLDAIQGGVFQSTLIRELARHAAATGTLLVDAGTGSPADALEVLSSGASEVVVGLETLHALTDLGSIARVVGSDRVVFSLDLRHGKPVLHPDVVDSGISHDPLSLATFAGEAGIFTLLLLDLGRIGSGRGVDLALVEALRQRVADMRLLAGGGVRTRRDLERMRDAGCDGALVASAIHAGSLTASDLAQFTLGIGQSGTKLSR